MTTRSGVRKSLLLMCLTLATFNGAMVSSIRQSLAEVVDGVARRARTRAASLVTPQLDVLGMIGLVSFCVFMSGGESGWNEYEKNVK